MKFSDIIALAKNGYSPTDIKELIQIANDVDAEEKNEEVNTDTPATENESKTDDPGSEPIEPKPDTDIITDLNKQIDDLRKQLNIAQSANINRNAEIETESDIDIIDNAFRNLIS